MPIELSTRQQLLCVGRTLVLKAPEIFYSANTKLKRSRARHMFTNGGTRGLLDGMQATKLSAEELHRVTHFQRSDAFSQHIAQASGSGRISAAAALTLTSQQMLAHIDHFLANNAGAEVLVIKHKQRPDVKRIEIVAGRHVHVLWQDD